MISYILNVYLFNAFLFILHLTVNSCVGDNPCMNEGGCDGSSGSPVCDCSTASGYTGVNCTEDIDECLDPNTCHNGGLCNNTEGHFTCDCASTGYIGDLCEIGKHPPL